MAKISWGRKSRPQVKNAKLRFSDGEGKRRTQFECAGQNRWPTRLSVIVISAISRPVGEFEEGTDFTSVKTFTVVKSGARRELKGFGNDTDLMFAPGSSNILNGAVKRITDYALTLDMGVPSGTAIKMGLFLNLFLTKWLHYFQKHTIIYLYQRNTERDERCASQTICFTQGSRNDSK